MAKKAQKKESKKVTKKTKAKPRKRKVVEPIEVTDLNRRDDSDAVFGRPAIWKNIEGTVVNAATYDKKTGYPKTVVFRPRNEGNSLITVPYNEVDALLNGYR
jgi:hypothetical protein